MLWRIVSTISYLATSGPVNVTEVLSQKDKYKTWNKLSFLQFREGGTEGSQGIYLTLNLKIYSLIH